ncbi:hypothetical protein [Sandaracinus amylolyticus]|uniref:hypothetical protein n=1 Tax=Sandaracinus amylolyticus TaxID=927083 RepID=UPI001F2790FB|nr:hypothetical protein [Sandaracinus amylolyticus]UJR86555.1 Hypothetical protein I5071_86560 [Sandaracinus amylolyticus]
MITTAMLVYLGLTLSLASLIVLWAAMMSVAVRRARASEMHPVLAIVPPLAALASWRAGERDLARGFVAVSIVYAVLVIVAHG